MTLLSCRSTSPCHSSGIGSSAEEGGAPPVRSPAALRRVAAEADRRGEHPPDDEARTDQGDNSRALGRSLAGSWKAKPSLGLYPGKKRRIAVEQPRSLMVEVDGRDGQQRRLLLLLVACFAVEQSKLKLQLGEWLTVSADVNGALYTSWNIGLVGLKEYACQLFPRSTMAVTVTVAAVLQSRPFAGQLFPAPPPAAKPFVLLLQALVHDDPAIIVSALAMNLVHGGSKNDARFPSSEMGAGRVAPGVASVVLCGLASGFGVTFRPCRKPGLDLAAGKREKRP
jgi:hypothetical protein